MAGVRHLESCFGYFLGIAVAIFIVIVIYFLLWWIAEAMA
jgi:hypothetical protein